jgi:hypothetical protein
VDVRHLARAGRSRRGAALQAAGLRGAVGSCAATEPAATPTARVALGRALGRSDWAQGRRPLARLEAVPVGKGDCHWQAAAACAMRLKIQMPATVLATGPGKSHESTELTATIMWRLVLVSSLAGPHFLILGALMSQVARATAWLEPPLQRSCPAA